MYFSQAGQDNFILNVLKEKKNGFFLEIGSNHPINWNNTYTLEKNYNWKGIMVEYDSSFLPLYKECRPNSIHLINDATKIDYKSVFEINNMPTEMDYLQIDLEVNNRSTLTTLEILDNDIFDKYKFATITFEHDIYTGNYFDTREKSREIFNKRGYICVFKDVCERNPSVVFEDWYIHPDLVNMEYINKLMQDNIVNYVHNNITGKSINCQDINFKKNLKTFNTCRRGIFYNSKKSLCSIWESGKMCYDALKNSTNYSLAYSEETKLDNSYDFAIFNQHFSVNNWISREIIKKFNKPTFCIVTEVTFGNNPIGYSPYYFGHYIVLDPTIRETNRIHAFGRPIEEFDLSTINSKPDDNSIPKIFSFGFATTGKEWHKIVEAVQNEYDVANIHFNIPMGTHVAKETHQTHLMDIRLKCKHILRKPGIGLRITSDNLTKTELIKLCSTKTINCFFYNREHIYKAGLAAVTDQAIASGVPLLITTDCTFRHIHKYLDCYPNIGIKEAIEKNKDGVLKMKQDWSQSNFLVKFEKILSTC